MPVDLTKVSFEEIVRAYEAGEIELLSARKEYPITPTGHVSGPADYQVLYIVMFGERKQNE